MVSLASITKIQKLAYTDGNHALTATLTADNKWEVKPSSVLDSGRYAIGLVMAGDAVRYSIVNPIGQITEALGISVPTSLR